MKPRLDAITAQAPAGELARLRLPCLAPTDGPGVEDRELRRRHLARIDLCCREEARLVPVAAGA